MAEAQHHAVIRNILVLWVMFAVFLGLSRFLPPFGSSALRSAATGCFLLCGTWVLMRVFARRLDRTSSPGAWGFSNEGGSILYFAAGLTLGFAMIALQIANISTFGDVTIVRNADLPSGMIALTIASYLAWAAVEELGFRSYPLFRLNDAFGFWRAQLIVALVFALYHIAGGVPLVPALLGTTVGSVAFGAAALASRGLALPIGLHASWNIGEWLLGSKNDRLSSPWQLDIAASSTQSVEVAGAIGYFVLYGAVIATCLWRIRKRRPLQSSASNRAESADSAA